ncbi:Pol-like protein [Elysia marginata]|uniref:Pol-like protein n=1 Tax=Elysia marginata TaxID=1093978 RepID=A0AAV4FTT9_9GAST|nr:Pol-like protein [Elysia marginata]
MLLLEIRGKSIHRASFLKKERNRKVEELENELKHISKTDKEQTSELFLLKREELEQMRAKVLEGVLIRAKARWIGQGEKTTRYFCNLENRHFASKRMTSLIKDSGVEIEDNKEITKEVENFYEHLYKSRQEITEEVNLEHRLKDETPRLSNEEASAIEGLITYREATNVLKKMGNNKSPGSSGFTVDFLKFFWKDIGPFLINLVKYSFQTETLPITL